MDIKEVEKLLFVTRANVRFYEKEGLINPKRKENNYRDYCEDDILQLKKILIFRKLGFTIKEISDMQNGELSLDKALDDNIKRLEDEIKDLQGSIELARKIEKDHNDFENMDENYYWDIMNSEEQKGKKFVDICNDYLMFESDMFDSMWKRIFFHDFKATRKKYGIPVACGVLLLICVMRGLSKQFLWHESFWEGFLYPFFLFLICSIIILPIYILSKKAPKIAGVIANILITICGAFLALVVLLLIVMLIGRVLNAAFNFW